ncbi:sugar phosphate isomerase/epimerase family protein [Cohnella zeiphila]|uniref:Sugar phosphate isomerase/epimerase n=1 Tax=Cohnella zeiphila TaxID=2761120 RepID=A0A7X0VVR9_9BACL|nr:sugar phosphate isomerase/epimerase family protein [Cohnella zeiphila]MBB6732444.1 sugar phosphate isomerase/epimerase [Cohnella zeiphila]
MNGTTIGWCARIEEAPRVAELGFDFIECPVTALRLEEKDGLGERIRAYKASPVPVRAVNVFFPGDMKLTGPDTSAARIRAYVEVAADALSEIGVRTAVIGSGGARSVPDGWDPERAKEQLLDALAMMGGVFRGSGVTLAIEPLNRRESNIINRVAEAAAYAQAVGSESVRILADLYHMDLEGEKPEEVAGQAGWLAHVHLAAEGRVAPGTAPSRCRELFAALRRAGYEGAYSVECNAPLTEESLPYLRAAWEEARP